MFSPNCIRRESVLALIEQNPGITKHELMDMTGLSLKAMEMHLARIVADKQAHSEPIPGQSCRSWHIGEPASLPRCASVFDFARACA